MLCTILDKTNFGLCKRPRNKKNIHTELMNYFFRDRFQNGNMIMVDIFRDPNDPCEQYSKEVGPSTCRRLTYKCQPRHARPQENIFFIVLD